MTRRPLLWLLLWLWPATAAADVACLADADVPTLLPGPACADVCVGENSVGVCVYYPPAFVQACAPMLGSSCYTADDGGCAIECLVGTRVLLYESWDEVLATRLAEVTTGDKHAYVNASLVRTLRGGPHGSLSLEASSSAPRFSVPETLLQDATAEATELSLKNIPMAITNASLPKLIVLKLANNSLSGYVPGNDSTPALLDMTISNNNLPTMKVPQKLESLIWTNAGVRTLPPSLSTAANIRRLDLSDNPLRTIPARTFLKLIDISTLILRNCSLTELPPDIEDKGSLSDFDISYNNLGRLNGSLLFSALGSRHTTVNLSYTNLTPLSLPASLKDEKWLIVNLDISGNDAIAATSFVQNLHDDWNKLSMRNCGLTKVPSIRSIRTSQTLDLRDNPIETLDFEAFDGFTIMLRNALVKTIPASMVNVTDWTIEDSALETLPAEYLYASDIRTIALPGNQLTELPTDDTKEVAARDLILRDNRLRKVQLALGTTEILDISSNGLTSLSLSGGSELQTLLLKNNSLTTFPEAVFNMPKLQILDIRENPIRNLTFTTDELASLARIPLVLFDGNQLLLASQTNCTRTVRLMQHVLCDPDGDGAAISQTPSPGADGASTASESTDTSSTRTIVIGVVVGVVVLLGITAGFLLYRRRQQQPRASTDAIVTKPHDEKSLGILRHDEDLLRHRLDVNRLHIDKIIASGAFGEVFLASYLDQRVVVKRLKAEHSVDRAQFLAFVREIKLLAAFRFPNIVPFVGVVWTKEADLGVVTAFMPNGDLRAHLDATQRRSRRSSNARTSTDPTAWTLRKLRMALDVAEALVYLHSLDPPLVHRDLKSRNVLLDGEWRACLSDFGTSRAVPSELVTMTGGVGTALWMAPEVLRGERYDTACDVFSLGVILSEMDTHLMPYARVGTPSSEEAAAASRGSLASASANRSSSLMSSLRLSRSGREEASNKDVDTGASTSSVLMEVLNGTAVLQFLPTCPAPIRQLAERCASHDASERPNALVVAYELRQMLRFETEQSGRRGQSTLL